MRTVKSVVDFYCPFCGRVVVVMAAAAGDGEPDSVAHGAPPCLRFQALDPLEYLKAVNSMMAGMSTRSSEVH